MKVLRFSVLVSALLTVGFCLPAAASSTAPTWQVAKSVGLPSDGVSLPQGFLPTLSCPSAGNCLAGGSYTSQSGTTEGLLVSEVSGTWKAGVTLSPPSNAGQNPAVSVETVSCASAGNCVAAGNYGLSDGSYQPFYDVETSGTWSQAKQVTLPSNALGTGQNSEVMSISCPSVGNCSAIGTYLDATTNLGQVLGFTLKETSGTWSNATQIVLPSSANTNPYLQVHQIACASAGNCTAVGSYVNSNGNTVALLLNETSGSWATALTPALPANASAYAGAVLGEVTCTSVGNCTAFGTYTNNAGAIEPLAVSEVSGKWSRGVGITMPAGAATNPHTFFYYGSAQMSCPSVGNCAAGGQYRDSSGKYQGFLVNEVNGKWQAATELKLPSGSQSAGANGGVTSVSCSSAGDCNAATAYYDASGAYQTGVSSEINNVWQTDVQISLPGQAGTIGIDGGIYGIQCVSTGACTASGSFEVGSSTYQGFTVNTN